MLVLSRRKNESVQINSTIQVTVIGISKGRVKLGITAPDDVRILRSELEHRPAGATLTPAELQWQPNEGESFAPPS